jgi:hypothetical protein
MEDDQQSAAPSHWRRRSRPSPIPKDEVVRQGDITSFAFRLLGKEKAIAFLNSDSPSLGGRPLAVATDSDAGQLKVKAELERMREHGSGPSQVAPDVAS